MIVSRQNKRRGVFMAVALWGLLLPGCDPDVPAMKEPVVVESEEEVLPKETASVRGLDFRLYEEGGVLGEVRRPSFWLHANHGTQMGDGVWNLEEVRVVIYGAEAGKAVLEAGTGHYTPTEGSERAYLSGGVVLTTATQRIELADVEWNNSEGRALSDKPLTIDGEKMQGTASAMEFMPKTGELNLKKGKLRWRVPERKMR